MATLAELLAYRDSLQEARFSGVRSFTDQNGESVHYRSQSEIEQAIRALDSEIAAMSAPRRSRILTQTSKGI